MIQLNIFNLDNYQNVLSNTTFLVLFITMLFYWISLIIIGKNYFFKIAKIGGSISNFILFFYLSWRWYKYKFFPLSNLYESLMFLACLLLFLYKFIEIKTKSKIIGALTIPLVLLIQGFASLSLPTVLQKSSPLVPSLQSNWLMLHVSMMMLSYATLLFGSLFSLLYLTLIQKNKFFQNSKLNLNNSNSKIFESLDIWSYRTIGLGFPFLTMGIISGAVWANEAWGSYWSWDPKETWALITWIIFAIYLHIRLTKNLKGEKTAFVGALGFFVVWICYLGVNFIGKGLHSYGWLN